jgi:hypothetical protein
MEVSFMEEDLPTNREKADQEDIEEGNEEQGKPTAAQTSPYQSNLMTAEDVANKRALICMGPVFLVGGGIVGVVLGAILR